jgi:hypothetical protein
MDVEKFNIYFVDGNVSDIPAPANSIVIKDCLENTVVMHFINNNLEIEYLGVSTHYPHIKLWQVKDRAHLEWVQLKWG